MPEKRKVRKRREERKSRKKNSHTWRESWKTSVVSSYILVQHTHGEDNPCRMSCYLNKQRSKLIGQHWCCNQFSPEISIAFTPCSQKGFWGRILWCKTNLHWLILNKTASLQHHRTQQNHDSSSIAHYWRQIHCSFARRTQWPIDTNSRSPWCRWTRPKVKSVVKTL